MRRLPPTDAFVDESVRGQRYYMGCVWVAAADLTSVRSAVQGLVVAHRRIHFHGESPERRRELLTAFTALPITATVVWCGRKHGVTEFTARDQCLTRIVQLAQQRKASRLVIESRQDDRDDARTILRARATRPPMVFEHRPGKDEPLLWVADGVTWAIGASNKWRTLVEPILRDVEQLMP